jgi:hypothetical protein
MTRELAKELKLAGFPTGPYRPGRRFYPNENDSGWPEAAHKEGVVLYAADLENRIVDIRNGYYCPDLPDLIDACGKNFARLYPIKAIWSAENFDASLVTMGNSPEEAVGKLWLALNKINASNVRSRPPQP